MILLFDPSMSNLPESPAGHRFLEVRLQRIKQSPLTQGRLGRGGAAPYDPVGPLAGKRFLAQTKTKTVREIAQAGAPSSMIQSVSGAPLAMGQIQDRLTRLPSYLKLSHA